MRDLSSLGDFSALGDIIGTWSHRSRQTPPLWLGRCFVCSGRAYISTGSPARKLILSQGGQYRSAEHCSAEDLAIFAQAREAAIRVGFWFVHVCLRCEREFENDEPPTGYSCCGVWRYG